MLALCLMLSGTYYAKNYAGIIGRGLFMEGSPLLGPYKKTGENDLGKQLWIQWKYYLLSKWVSWCQGDGLSSVGTQAGAIKLAMAGTYDWWFQFPPFLSCW